MRWIPFGIFLYACTGLQWAQFGSLGGTSGSPRVEYLALLTVFYALYSPEETAPLAGLVCGLAYDWASAVTPGTWALPLALVGYGVVRVRMSIFREQRITQFVITLLAVVVFALLAMALRAVLAGMFGLPGQGMVSGRYLVHMTANALYTAAVAPAVFWLLQGLRGFLGFAGHGGHGGRVGRK